MVYNEIRVSSCKYEDPDFKPVYTIATIDDGLGYKNYVNVIQLSGTITSIIAAAKRFGVTVTRKELAAAVVIS